jgi:hypothetical protein
VSIVFDPAKLLKKIAPEKKVKRLLKGNLSLKKTALSFVDDMDFLNRKRVTDVALKTVRAYQERRAKAAADAGTKAAGKELQAEILDDPKLLIQRVQNEVVFQVHQGIKEKYAGRRARWLPSSANEPRPEHQLNYGKEYEIGEGIDGVEPGDEYGCQCGVEILGSETKLDL